MSKSKYLQDVWPLSTCFGCGPACEDGMQIKSKWSDDGNSVVADYTADKKFNAGFPEVMYGGTVASLIDCHSIWTAIAFNYKKENRDVGSEPALPFVTGTLTVKYYLPTPLGKPVQLKAWVEGEVGRKTRVICELSSDGVVTAKGDVLAVMMV